MNRFDKAITVVFALACLFVLSPLYSHGLKAQSSLSERIRARSCSNESLESDYGFSFDGTTTFGPVAAVGKITFDGDGKVSGNYSESLGGFIIKGNFVGTYAVHSNCTVSATFMGATTPSSWSAQSDGVIVNDGRELLVVGTDSGTVVKGVLKKLTHRRAESR